MMDGQKEMTACQETTEAHLECEKPTSVDLEPEVEHLEVPKEDVVKLVEGQRRQRRGPIIWPPEAEGKDMGLLWILEE